MINIALVKTFEKFNFVVTMALTQPQLWLVARRTLKLRLTDMRK